MGHRGGVSVLSLRPRLLMILKKVPLRLREI